MTAGQLVVPSSKVRNESSEWSVPFLRELLEVDVPDPLAQHGNPVFGELEEHDVAGVEVDADVLAPKLSTKAFISAGVVR